MYIPYLLSHHSQRELTCIFRAAMKPVIQRCVVLQIGLAVGDIAEVQKHALLKRIAMQVSPISLKLMERSTFLIIRR